MVTDFCTQGFQIISTQTEKSQLRTKPQQVSRQSGGMQVTGGLTRRDKNSVR
jgi:hypothetical protein